MTPEQAQHRQTISLALCFAREAVANQLKAQRCRLYEIDHKEIMARAGDYLAAHPELIAKAKAIIESRAHPRANLKTNARTGKVHKSGTSSVQISGAK
jgi:hypothetical protein